MLEVSAEGHPIPTMSKLPSAVPVRKISEDSLLQGLQDPGNCKQLGTTSDTALSKLVMWQPSWIRCFKVSWLMFFYLGLTPSGGPFGANL